MRGLICKVEHYDGERKQSSGGEKKKANACIEQNCREMKINVNQTMKKSAQMNTDNKPGVSNQQCRYMSKEGNTDAQKKINEMMRTQHRFNCKKKLVTDHDPQHSP